MINCDVLVQLLASRFYHHYNPLGFLALALEDVAVRIFGILFARARSCAKQIAGVFSL